MDIKTAQSKIAAVKANIEKVMVGKSREIELVLVAMAAGGHVLLEDVPGTGKTTFAKAIAASMDGAFKRIQFTPDLLPSDLTGINVYNPKTGDFTFRKGGLFTNILLADEINRATPRTQAGLLECMEEQQISIDGETYPLGAPYFVMATQNPVETQGTFPLPEAQLDRFLMQLAIGYPTQEGEADVVARFLGRSPLTALTPVVTAQDWVGVQEAVAGVKVHKDLCLYIAALAQFTRTADNVSIGVSPRASLALARAAQALAVVHGRSFVKPEDIKQLVKYVWPHRIAITRGIGAHNKAAVVQAAIANVPVPTEDFA